MLAIGFIRSFQYVYRDSETIEGAILAQAAQAHYVWAPASEVIWSEYTRIISVLSDAK